MSHYYKDGMLVPEGTPGALPSVTTILSIRDKPSLRDWRDRVGAEAADLHQQARADLGTEVHRCIELLVNNQIATSLMKEVGPYLSGFINWQRKYAPTDMQSEVYLESTEGYCGTADLICRINGQLYVVDWKTGRKSIDTALQLAAYQMAYWEKTKEWPVRAAVYLTDKTKRGYQWVAFSPMQDFKDFNMFMSHKNVFEWSQPAPKQPTKQVIEWI